jgi:hypothetical protein
MRHITPQHMIGFTDELTKEARIGEYLKRARGFLQKNQPLARGIGWAGKELKGRYGRQMLLGSGLGAAGGAAVADPDEEGGRLRGALKGALLGGGIAGGRILATKAGREAAKKGTSHFLQRQRYGLTGRGLGDTPTEQLSKAREIGLVGKATEGMSPKALKRLAAEEHAFGKGYMSVPGVAHAMMSKDAPDLLRSAWQRSGMLGKGFAGLGAYQGIKGFAEKPEEGGPGRLEKGMRGLGSTVGWLVAPGGLLAGHLVGEGLGKVTGTVGKGGDIAAQVIKQRRAQQAAQRAPQAGAYGQNPWSRGG